MKSTLHAELFRYLESNRGSLSVDEQLRGWLEVAAEVSQRRERLQAWLAYVGVRRSRESGEFLSNAEVASFMATLGAVGGCEAVLDPACGAGLLLAYAGEKTGASVVHGIEINEQVAELSRLLAQETAVVFNGDSLTGEFALAELYDLILSEPPFNSRLSHPFLARGTGEAMTEIGDALLCWSAAKLSPQGRAVFLLSTSFLNSRGDRLRSALVAMGVHVRALIHVPSGQLKATDVESYIVVVDRHVREKIFTAQFGTDESLQQQILANYEAHRAGSRPAQGRLVEMLGFLGFKALEATERLAEHAKRSGLKPILMRDLVTECIVMKNASVTVDDAANDLYLSLAGKCEAVLQPDAVATKTLSVARLVINEEKADARFVVASLNRKVGRLFLESISLPSYGIRRVSVDSLLAGTFYLPERTTQAKVMEAVSKVHSLRAELDGRLQLLDPEGDVSLRLLPFVRVMASPKTETNACYFYNKRQSQNQKYVSYHCETESEIEDFYADTQAALEGLTPLKTPNS